MDLLEYGRARSVTHGGLANPGSYVLSGQTVKLINVGREVDSHDATRDQMELRQFINTNPYLNGNASAEWGTLDMLLESRLVTNFSRGWKNVVVGHPMLSGSAEDIIAAFDGVNTSVEQLTLVKATKLANLLYTEFPHFHDRPLIPNPQGPNDYHENLRFYFRRTRVFNRLFNNYYDGVKQLYQGDKIYLEIIRLVRNCIHHAAKYDERLADSERLLTMMRENFTHYISLTYSFLHMLNDKDADYPYKSNDKPSTPSIGDYLDLAMKRTRRGRG
ncbi:uncharacterized protein LOC125555551 [Triticum urartu]|uniref:uncharacterized protein LOC125555551 n=1 Tax=Triticum urartu TaxID=4572 RepID=UPI0020438C6C|nr:uncharacterized protein LOC125555551 [Triticum urartu]